jgi:hypothetical protein
MIEIFIASFTPSPPSLFAISGGNRDEKVVHCQRYFGKKMKVDPRSERLRDTHRVKWINQTFRFLDDRP